MSAKRKPNLTTKKLLQAIEHVTEQKHGDVCTGDIAAHLNYHTSGILRWLTKLQRLGYVSCREVQGGRMPLWCLSGIHICVECDTKMEYSGTEWFCPACSCFGEFDNDSAECKCCGSAVECFEVES